MYVQSEFEHQRFMRNSNAHAQQCREVTDYEAESVKELWSKVVGNLGITPTGQRLDIYRVHYQYQNTACINVK